MNKRLKKTLYVTAGMLTVAILASVMFGDHFSVWSFIAGSVFILTFVHASDEVFTEERGEEDE